MPVWHDKTKQLVKDGKLVVLGITQEQHAERCRLFCQWKGIDFPIVQDPITALGTRVVPLFVAIDEHGIVRQTRANPRTFERTFVTKKFDDDAPKATTPAIGAERDLAKLAKKAKSSDTHDAWRALGDARLLWGGDKELPGAIEAYRAALTRGKKDGPTLFRLGVAHRRRYDGTSRRLSDFQKAVDYWGQALATNPNQYIWRRRIQQYGPRLDKPYPFYDWVATAQKEIRARGEKPVELTVAIVGAEIAQPARNFGSAPEADNPDPKGKITRDALLVRTEVTVVPRAVKAGRSGRALLTVYPNQERKVHWNNEVRSLQVWIDAPKGWVVSERLLTAKQPNAPATNEKRTVDFEFVVPADAKGEHTLNGFVLYNVCEDIGGTCRYLRQDVKILVRVE